MSGKMSLSALLYFAANPGLNDDDVFARLTRSVRKKHPDIDERIRTRAEALSRKVAVKRQRLCANKSKPIG